MTPDEVKAFVEDTVNLRVQPLEEKVNILQKDLTEVLKLLTKIEGAGTFIKILFWIAAPVFGAIYWIKDHVRL